MDSLRLGTAAQHLPRCMRGIPTNLPDVYDAVPVGLCTIGPDLRLLSINRRMAEMTGRPAAEDIGRILSEVAPGIAAQLTPELQRVLRGERVTDLELRGTLMGTSWTNRVFLVSLAPLRGMDGAIDGVLCSALDITERKLAEEALRDHRERLTSLIEQVAVGIAQTDLEGRFMLVNERFAQICGRERRALLGSSMLDITHPGDVENNRELVGRLLQTGDSFSLEKRYIKPDGSSVWVSNYVSAMRDVAGRPQFLLAIVQDITARKDAEAALRESEDHYRHTVEFSPLVSWTADPDGTLLEVSSRWETLTGIPVAEGLQGWAEAIHPEDRPSVQEAWNAAVRSGTPLDVEYRLRSNDGSYRWARGRAAPRRDPDGTIIRWYGTVADVHTRKLADLALRESEALTRSVVESSTECIKVLDLEGRLLFMNSAALQRHGTREFAPFAGRDWTSMIPDTMVADAERAMVAARAGQTAHYTGRSYETGAPTWWDVIVSPITDADGAVTRILVMSRDITETRSAQEQITRLVYQDALTDLPNRRLIRQELDLALARTSSSEQTALHYIDLDHFKTVNDSLGHLVGDALLRQAAERLRRCVRRSDVVARLGGDEFAILQTGVHAPEDAATLASHVIAAFASPFQLDGHQVTTGVSVGVALAPRDASTPDDLVRGADIALYRAKADGRNTFRFFEPHMAEAIRRKEELKAGLGTALEQDGFALFFQPLVCLRSGRVTGFEALARLQHPARGLISPAEFIPVAEESGLIGRLGNWALLAACCEAVRWPEPARVAVNLSPAQLRDAGLMECVKEALARSGLAPERLELEITESVLMQDSEANVAALQALRQLGVRIAIDDFGTGFSSLSYLLRFSFDKIKIDRSFIAELPGSVQSKAIIRAVASIGRGLGISITAEGVETAEQLAMVRRQGCAEAQGYVFSRPVPAADVAALFHGGPLQVLLNAGLGPERRIRVPRTRVSSRE